MFFPQKAQISTIFTAFAKCFVFLVDYANKSRYLLFFANDSAFFQKFDAVRWPWSCLSEQILVKSLERSLKDIALSSILVCQFAFSLNYLVEGFDQEVCEGHLFFEVDFDFYDI